MKSRITKKLILLLILLLIAFIMVSNERSKIVFIDSIKKTKLYQDNDIKKVDTLILNSKNEKTNYSLSGIINKYDFVKSKLAEVCTTKGTSTLVSREDKSNIISVESGNDYEYFSERNGKCTSVAKISNVNFTESIGEAYANDSIYTSFESLTNFEQSGMMRVNATDVIPFDTSKQRYTSPIAFSKGVLMVENNRNVVAFDEKDKIVFRQNSVGERGVLSINLVGKSLFMVVKKGNKVSLEGYDVSDEKAIVEAQPKLEYDISSYFNSFDAEITIKGNSNYGSFTIGGKTLVVSSNFSKVVILSNADTALDIDQDIIYLKSDELYYIINLKTLKKEDIGKIKALNFKAENKELYFTLLDDKSQEKYIKFVVK